MNECAEHLPHLLLIFKIDQLRSLTSRKSSKLVFLPMRIEHTRFAEKSTYYVTRINLVEFSEVFSSKKGSKMSDDDVTTALVVLLTLFFILLLFITCFCHKWKLVHPLVKYKYYKRFFLIRRIDLLIKPCEQTTTRPIEHEILNRRLQLRGQWWSQQLDFGQKTVLVFCVVSSRIGTDIDSAMRGVNEYSPVILVILHFIDKSLLHGELSDNEYLLDDRTRNRMLGIAHFAFSERHGLYGCQQNEVGIEKVLSLLEASVAAKETQVLQ